MVCIRFFYLARPKMQPSRSGTRSTFGPLGRKLMILQYFFPLFSIFRVFSMEKILKHEILKIATLRPILNTLWTICFLAHENTLNSLREKYRQSWNFDVFRNKALKINTIKLKNHQPLGPPFLFQTRSLTWNGLYMRRFTSTLQAWHKIVLFSAHVQINLEKLITSS